MKPGGSLCQICDGARDPDSPLPLCASCLVAAYRHVRSRLEPAEAKSGRRGAQFTKGEVYYARMGDRVKIGTSHDPVVRIRGMSLPADALLAVEPGGRWVEQQRHRQFAHLRVGKEWFRAAPELLDHIDTLKAGGP